jgi:NADPH:quinone reductase-like Zn-dependent oxidoreductase
MTMRAWQVHEHGSPADVLRLVDLAVPQPGPGEIRVRVAAAAIGMPDVFMCRGTYRLTPALPFVPGQEVCGIVDAVGDGVEIALGTRVMGVTSFFDGRFLVVGFASGQWLQVSGGDLTLSNRSVIGVIAHAGTPEEHADAHEKMLTLAADGTLETPVTTVPFDDLPQAVEAVAAGTVIGKMVVQVDAPDHNS